MLALLVVLAVSVALDLAVVLSNGTPDEAVTRDQPERLLAEHDARPWQSTSGGVVDRSAQPRSRP